MRFGSLATVVALIGSSLLAACGSGSTGTAQVRLLNASVGYPSLNLNVNGTVVNTNVAYAGVGSYVGISTTNDTTLVTDPTGTTVYAPPGLTLSGNNTDYSIIAYGYQGTTRTTTLSEEQTTPTAANTTTLLILNLAPDAGAVDAYLTTAGSTGSVASISPAATDIAGGSSSGYMPSVTSGTYRLVVTGTGTPNDVRLDTPTVVLPTGTVQTIILTSGPSGYLVNAILEQQQGSVTNLPGTLARARVIDALSNTTAPSVTAKLNGVTLASGVQQSGIIPYQNVGAGTATLSVTVNGVATPVSTATPFTSAVAGTDYTLLVWGPVTAPQVSVLTDSNLLPTVAGYANVRLINGMADLTSGATMASGLTQVANNILAGTSSAPIRILPSTQSYNPTFTVTTSTLQQFTSTTYPIIAGGVYTFVIAGDATGQSALACQGQTLSPGAVCATAFNGIEDR